MDLNEKLLIDLVKTCAPEKKIQQIPFPRLTYKEAMEKYGTDRPDLREDKNDPNLMAFCWVIDFPFFEKTSDGGWTFTHNPFSNPQEGESLDIYKKYLIKKLNNNKEMLSEKDIASILTAQYDIVLNGLEVGGGSIRAYQPLVLGLTLGIMGYREEEIKEKFGHMLKALSYAPPHGGIAWGLDRLVTLLSNEPNIREVIAFPKTGDARDLMMDAPSELEKKQLEELHIEIKKSKK